MTDQTTLPRWSEMDVIEALLAQVGAMNKGLQPLMAENNRLRARVDELERENQDLHGQLDARVYRELKREQS